MGTAAVEVVVVDWDGPAAAVAGRLAALRARGVDVVLVRVPATEAGDEPVDAPAGAPGRTALSPPGVDAAGWARRRLAGVGAPEGAVVVADDLETLDDILSSPVPAPVVDPSWALQVDGSDPETERRVESWLTVGNGRTGTRGSLEAPGPASLPAVYVAGVYGRDPAGGESPELVRGPEWTRLRVPGGAPPARCRRTLDMRQGVLFGDAPGFRSSRFASLADRRLLVLQAEGAQAGEVPAPPASGALGAAEVEATPQGTRICIEGRGGGTAWFALSTAEEQGRTTRMVAVDRDGPADDALAVAVSTGAEALFARHRRALRERWVDADVVVEGDAHAQRALRFALYHLLIAGDPEDDRASIGARALSGPGYRGHVFWDTEIFVLPFFVWTHPETARALLAYRHRTLPAARDKAARMGYRGALFAWESADTGEEATPDFVVLPDGTSLAVLTGAQEHHVAADVAWAVWQYWRVTGDRGFLEEKGAELIVETARFWASRAVAEADGRHHIRSAIGPDEYHEGVDDSVYTNVLARWNLRAAEAVCALAPDVAARLGAGADERQGWEEVATGLVERFDEARGLHEEFEGFFELDDERAVDLAARPFSGELVLGVERLRASQVVKQADVVLLGAVLPEEVDPEVQAANYRYYEPRTSHGSSLSPAMHALVAARLGDLDAALAYFHLAGKLDLEDVMGNAANGVHIATMGGLWQAALFGFGGIRADGDAVRIDPRLPRHWERLAFPVRWRGTRIAVDVRRSGLELDLDGPAAVAVGLGAPTALAAGRFVVHRQDGGWSTIEAA